MKIIGLTHAIWQCDSPSVSLFDIYISIFVIKFCCLSNCQDENCSNRPVCSYVQPLRAGRLLDTPRQAARFVNLIGYEKMLAVGGGNRLEQWTSMHAFLCRNKGVC